MHKRHVLILIVLIAFFTIFFVYVFHIRKTVQNNYNYAISLKDEGNYEEAIEIFSSLGNYQDSYMYIEEANQIIKYKDAKLLFDKEQYIEAEETFIILDDYQDSKNWVLKSRYAYAIQLYEEERYEESVRIFLELGDYEESRIYYAKALLPLIKGVQETVYNEALKDFEAGNYKNALANFEILEDYKDSQRLVKECKTNF